MSLFMQADGSLSDKFLRDIVMAFMIAGRDVNPLSVPFSKSNVFSYVQTTAATLSFAFFLLATHTEIQDRVYNEIIQVFNEAEEEKEDAHGRVTFEMLKKMPYLDGIVFEVLRLFPAVPLDPKQAARDSVLPNGAVVKKGTIMVYEPQ